MRRSSCSESLALLVFRGSPLELVKERAGGFLKGLRHAIGYFKKKKKRQDMSSYLLNSKSNGPVMLFKTIFMYRN